jgi:hypothetical protein
MFRYGQFVKPENMAWQCNTICTQRIGYWCNVVYHSTAFAHRLAESAARQAPASYFGVRFGGIVYRLWN